MKRIPLVLLAIAICTNITNANTTNPLEAPLKKCNTCSREIIDENLSTIFKLKKSQEIAKHKSGYYLGLYLGMPVIKYKLNSKPEFLVPLLYGVKFGITTFFTESVGIRGYIAVDMGDNSVQITKKAPITGVLGNASIGLDFLYDIKMDKNSYFNLYCGIGVDYYYFLEDFTKLKSINHNFSMALNFGFGFNFFIHNRLDFGAKIMPNTSIATLDAINLNYGFLPYIEYSYKF